MLISKVSLPSIPRNPCTLDTVILHSRRSVPHARSLSLVHRSAKESVYNYKNFNILESMIFHIITAIDCHTLTSQSFVMLSSCKIYTYFCPILTTSSSLINNLRGYSLVFLYKSHISYPIKVKSIFKDISRECRIT